MAFRLRDIPELLRTPLGRTELWNGLFYRTWRAQLIAAAPYRRIVVPRTRVIVVVGSYGKTTTARAVLAALGPLGRSRQRANGFHHLTAAVLAMRPWDRRAVFEVGISHPGQMAGYARLLRPNVTVVTSIGSEHNRSMPSLEVTRHEKADMVRSLPPDGLAVLNGDDPNVRWMASQTRARVQTFGFEPGNDVWASDYALDWPRGSSFLLHAAGQRHEVRSQLLGRHQVYPLLAAVTVALAEGRSGPEALAGLAGLGRASGRLELVALPGGAWLVCDDYKSSLETIEAALDVLAEIPAARKIVVIGEVSEPPGSMGPIYRRLGGRLAEIADRVIVVGEHHRRYAAGAERAGMSRASLLNAGRDPLRAVQLLRELLQPGDVVLIKGRSSQRLARIALALVGRDVRCTIANCGAATMACNRCPMLERGWVGPPIPI